MELFLRGNWKILEQLRDEWHTEQLAGRLGRVEEMKRKRLEERSAAGKAALEAARAGGRSSGAHGQGFKRARVADGGGSGAASKASRATDAAGGGGGEEDALGQEDAVDGDGVDGEAV